MTEDIFATIAGVTVRAVDDSERRAKLLAFIKTETRWRLLSRPVTPPPISRADYRAARREFVAVFAAARHRRAVPATSIFYDAVAEQAAAFALLIEARRQCAR